VCYFSQQEEPAEPCDDGLPDISVEDVKRLQQTAPDLMSELHIADSLESSMVVRTCLSQSSLTKLVDPRQNKTLEETVAFREKALVDNKQLTMSVLKREISCSDVQDFSFPENVAFKVGSPDTMDELDGNSNFEAGSLHSLSKGRIMTGSSDSEALFHSAELDFSCPSPGVSSPIAGEIESPSSVKSRSSGKSSSGKSSSSPISIKPSASRRWRLSQSLSPESIPVLKEELFSLPNIEQEKSITTVVDDKDSSQNSCRSLSEAIKSVETNKKLVQSSDLVKTTNMEVKELKSNLYSVKEHTIELTKAFQVKLSETKSLLNILQENKKRAQNSEETISTLSKDKETLEHKYEVDTKNLRQQFDELDDKSKNELEELNSKYINDKSQLEESIKMLQNENDELRTLKIDNEYQITEISNENKKLRELYEELNSEHKEKCSYYQQEIDNLNKKYEEKYEESTEIEKSKQNIILELNEVKVQLQSLIDQKQSLEGEIESISESTQKNIDEHLDHVSSVTTQNKELKKKLADKEKKLGEKEQELSQALFMKDTLEAQKQNNFNAVFNKIKREKDAQIKEMSATITTLEKELQAQKSRGNTLNVEINMHKEAYSSLQIDLDKLKEDNNQLGSRMEEQNNERVSLQTQLNELSENNNALEEEKLRVMQELKVQYADKLEKEKASLLLVSEVEKEKSLEEVGKSEHAIKMSTSSSIE